MLRPRRPQILLAAAFVLIGLTLSSYLARLGYPFELFSHFRPQYAALCAVVCIVLLMRKEWRIASLTLAAATANAVAAFAPFLVIAPPLQPAAETRRVIWANVHGDMAAAQRLAAFVETNSADVVAITEAHELVEVAGLFPDHPCVIGNGASSAFSVILFTRAPCPIQGAPITSPWPHATQRVVLNDELTVVAAHGARPVDTRMLAMGPKHWLSAGQVSVRDEVLHAAANAARTDAPALLVGDMNAAPWSPIAIQTASDGLVRISCGAPWVSTWPVALPVIGLPLDHAYVTSDMAAGCRVGPNIGSDHRPLVIDVAPADVSQQVAVLRR